MERIDGIHAFLHGLHESGDVCVLFLRKSSLLFGYLGGCELVLLHPFYLLLQKKDFSSARLEVGIVRELVEESVAAHDA